MIAVFTVLLVLTVSLVVIRVAAAALTMTGISRDLAQFQALSAFTGSGFTTKESEEIVNHPVRRRIVMHLMLLGNAGIVVALASVLRLVLVSDGGNDHDWYDAFWFRVVTLLFGVALLWFAASSTIVEKLIWKINSWAMSRWMHIDVRDYTRLFHLAENYAVSELRIHAHDWLAGRRLQDLKLSSEGVLVLGIERKGGHYVGTPRGESLIEEGDCLIMYGRQETLAELHSRSEGMLGNMRHVIAVTRQADLREQEAAEAEEAEERGTTVMNDAAE